MFLETTSDLKHMILPPPRQAYPPYGPATSSFHGTFHIIHLSHHPPIIHTCHQDRFLAREKELKGGCVVVPLIILNIQKASITNAQVSRQFVLFNSYLFTPIPSI